MPRARAAEPDLGMSLGESTKISALRVLHVTWGQLLPAATALLGVRLYTELLAPAAYGQCMLALGVVTFLDSVTTLALNQTLLSNCSRHGDMDRRREVSIGLTWLYLKRVWLVEGVLSAACGVSLALLSGRLYWLLLPMVAFVYTGADAAKTSLVALLLLDREYARYAVWTSTEGLLTLSGTLATLYLLQRGAFGFVLGYSLARAVSAALFIRIYRSGHLKGFVRINVQDERRSALQQGLPVAAMGPLGWVSTYLDRFVLAGFLGPAATGVYAASTGLVARPYSVTTAVLTNYFRPLYYESGSMDDHTRYRRILWQWVTASLVLGALGALGLLVIGGLVADQILAKPYRHEAHEIMALFAVAQTFAITTHAADNALLAMRRGARLMRAQALLAVVTVPLVVFGVVLGGVRGAVIGRCCAEGIKLGVALAMARTVIEGESIEGPDREIFCAEEGAA